MRETTLLLFYQRHLSRYIVSAVTLFQLLHYLIWYMIAVVTLTHPYMISAVTLSQPLH
jgi:hypothetical protein